jgi:predicted ABC-type transport system involved in lysophospholipase L1 biosynthesis ATPase subunit
MKKRPRGAPLQKFTSTVDRHRRVETVHDCCDGAEPRLAIVAALEAIEAGDIALAVEILLSALEDGARELRSRCPVCGQAFEWPGLRDAHVLAAHPFEDAA